MVYVFRTPYSVFRASRRPHAPGRTHANGLYQFVWGRGVGSLAGLGRAAKVEVASMERSLCNLVAAPKHLRFGRFVGCLVECRATFADDGIEQAWLTAR